MPVAQRLAGKAGRGKAGSGHVNAQFFAKLTDQGEFGRFIALDLAAREFPQARHAAAWGTLLYQNPALAIDQRHSNNR